MSECTGCFNGCAQITSDQCVKYTGNDIEFLGIENGMPLSEIEEKITDYLQTVLSGEGIIPTLPTSLCTLITDLLPTSGDITLSHIITALLSSACSLQTQIDNITTDVETIESDYIIGACLSGVTASSGTHNILQAVIYQLCNVSISLTALQVSLGAYVKIDDINTYIATYLSNNVPSTKMYSKMVPYVAVEYYGDISNFSIDGTGLGDWEQIYLCNGLHGTPDKRGVFPVGVTEMGNAPYSGSILYGLNDTGGNNNVYLATANLPAHTHNTEVFLLDPGHRHLFAGDNSQLAGGYQVNPVTNILNANLDQNSNAPGGLNLYTKNIDNTNNLQETGITVSGVTVDNTGQDIAHENRPPYRACYYIMYVPS